MSEVSTKVITPVATLSFPHLHEPSAGRNPKPGDKLKYSAALVYAPGTDLTALYAAEIAAAEKKWPGKGAEYLRIRKIKTAFRDDAEAKGYPAGSIYQNVRTEQKPGLVYSHAGPDGKPAKVEDKDIREVFYAGAQVRASISFFGYDNESKGVSAGLNNMQKVGEGTRLAGSRTAAEDDFTADLSKAPVDISGLV